MNLEKYLVVADEIKNALENNLPVVALESTIISHGMPYPQNSESAIRTQNVIRESGAIPATVAILGGKLKVGLTDEEIHYLGKKGYEVRKASRRDLAVLVSQKQDGATTVATTMILAKLAGIKVFATGGIGGVHRGAETTMDISADLEELAMTDVAVVCSGAKSILDLGLTMEYLETKGVPVVGYQTEDLPGFYTRESGFKVDYRLDTVKEIADAFKTKQELGLMGGMVVANPIPKEFALDSDFINGAINEAVKEAEKQGIKGKAATPFLLSKLKEITKGVSLASNIELVLNNARVAAQLAIEYSKISK